MSNEFEQAVVLVRQVPMLQATALATLQTILEYATGAAPRRQNVDVIGE